MILISTVFKVQIQTFFTCIKMNLTSLFVTQLVIIICIFFIQWISYLYFLFWRFYFSKRFSPCFIYWYLYNSVARWNCIHNKPFAFCCNCSVNILIDWLHCRLMNLVVKLWQSDDFRIRRQITSFGRCWYVCVDGSGWLTGSILLCSRQLISCKTKKILQ